MKKLVLFILSLFLILTTCACNGDKAGILFNNVPITKETALDYKTDFQPNQRIYYLVLIPKKIYTQKIEIQIIKKDNSYGRLGYNLYWSHFAHLKEEQMYYYDDYVVISQPGIYIMKIYSKDKPTKLLCSAEFYVGNN